MKDSYGVMYLYEGLVGINIRVGEYVYVQFRSGIYKHESEEADIIFADNKITNRVEVDIKTVAKVLKLLRYKR